MNSDSLDILAVELFGGRPRFFWLKLIRIIYVSGRNVAALVLIRLIRHFHYTGQSRLGRMASARLRDRFGCFVHPEASIGPGLILPHPNGIIIGKNAVVGRNCTIFQQVTLGGKASEGASVAYPQLGNHVKLFAGAKIIGDVSIGDHCIIGANAVVLKNVPERHNAVGVPSVNISQDKIRMEKAARSQ